MCDFKAAACGLVQISPWDVKTPERREIVTAAITMPDVFLQSLGAALTFRFGDKFGTKEFNLKVQRETLVLTSAESLMTVCWKIQLPKYGDELHGTMFVHPLDKLQRILGYVSQPSRKRERRACTEIRS